jgi:hypothetical protein
MQQPGNNFKTRREFTSSTKMFWFDRFEKRENYRNHTCNASGSSVEMMDAFPERAFDVGTEQHAVTASATQGMTFSNIYSTFLLLMTKLFMMWLTKSSRNFLFDRLDLDIRQMEPRTTVFS